MRCFIDIFFVQFCTLFIVYSKANWENKLVLDIFDSKPNTSIVVAVLPLRLSLCKLASIAEGKAKVQLLNALNVEKDIKTDSCYSPVSEMLNKLKESDLILLNKIYLNYSKEVDTKFLANSSSLYGVNVDFVGFNTPRTAFSFINNGITSATYRRIRDIIEIKDITDQTKMMMITAVHLKATWEVLFDVKETKNRKFFHFNNKVSDIPMMNQEDHFQVFEGRNYKILSVKLRSPGFWFTIIVPNQPKEMLGLLKNMRMNPNLLKEARAEMKSQPRMLVMPRLKIKSYQDLTDVLKNSTVNEILNSSTSDLNKILKEKFRNSSGMFLSKVKQKLFLEVDEFGIARNERTLEEIEMSGPRWEPIRMPEFAADRPFLFIFDLVELIPINKRLTMVPHQLFSGIYYGPE